MFGGSAGLFLIPRLNLDPIPPSTLPSSIINLKEPFAILRPGSKILFAPAKLPLIMHGSQLAFLLVNGRVG